MSTVMIMGLLMCAIADGQLFTTAPGFAAVTISIPVSVDAAKDGVLAVAREMLDTHLRIAQTECNKSRAPTGEAFTEEQLRRRGWHSGTCSSALFCVQSLKRSLCRRLAS